MSDLQAEKAYEQLKMLSAYDLDRAERIECWICLGSGDMLEVVDEWGRLGKNIVRCSRCNGTGWVLVAPERTP